MRGLASWVVLAAVAVLGLAAAVDALRAERDARPPRTETTRRDTRPETRARGDDAWRAAAAGELRAEAIRGTLAWTDRRCRVRAVSLPDLEDVPTVGGRACTLQTSPGWLAYDLKTPAPDGGSTVRCRGGAIEVVGKGWTVVRVRFLGCPPAWKRDGTLTFVRDGDLAALATCENRRACARILVSRGDLARSLARDPWAFRRPAFKEVGWLDDETFAALVRDSERREDVIGIFRSRRLVSAPAFSYRALSDLRVSPYGNYVAARVEDDGLVVLDERGRFQTTGLRSAYAVTWSPDETWTAMATADGVFVFKTGERPAGLIHLDIQASDLVWR